MTGPVTIEQFRRRIGSGCADVADIVLESAERAEHLNAFISLDPDDVRRRYRAPGEPGPLAGIPIVVKDNIHVAGQPNTAGTPALARYVPSLDASAIRRLVAAGAVPVGKTNMHELALGATTDNTAFGPVRHPVDPHRFVGGSSGGTAAAVAAGVAPLGLGTDTGGSVRIPAALTGLCGLRPTPGRYPAGGVTPLSWTRDTIGPMAVTMADLAAVDQVLAAALEPPVPRDVRSMVLGLPMRHFTDDLEQGVNELWESALDRLRSAGAHFVSVDLDAVVHLSRRAALPIVSYEAQRGLNAYLAGSIGADLIEVSDAVASPDVKALLLSSVLPGAPEEISVESYARALLHRARIRRRYAGVFARGVDAVIYPTTPATAGRLTDAGTMELNGRRVPTFGTYIRNTDPGSLAGLPGVTVPMGRDRSGLPAGFGFDCPAGGDRDAIAIGLALEPLLGEVPGPRADAATGVR